MPNFKSRLLNRLPAWSWLSQYNPVKLKSDVLAALIVVAMLVPQGMAYAMLAGLPPIMGLYASILPMIIYALLGGSTTLSIGPVAIISMMTFATLNPLFEVGSPVYIEAATLLALMVGIISLLLGVFRFGFDSADQPSRHSEFYYCFGSIDCFWSVQVSGGFAFKSQ